MVEFEWTVSLGQIISSIVIVGALALGDVVALTFYRREHARIETLEAEVANLRTEIERFTEIIKRNGS